MKRVIAVAFSLAVLVGVGVAAAQMAGRSDDRVVTVAAAASLTDVLPSISAAFESAHPGTTVRMTFAGSAQLVEQVVAGAPIDVLVTASEATMAKAVESRAVREPIVFAANAMTIAVPVGNPGGVRGLADLARPEVTTVICAPSVPCGAAAESLLARNGISFTPSSLELDVRSALGKVLADEVDAAIVYVTDVTAADGRAEQVPIPDDANVVTRYAAAAVDASPDGDDADAFVQFLEGDAAQTILRANGFRSPS